MSLLDTASLVITPNGYKEGKLYSVVPSDGSGDLNVTRATTATRVNESGLVELVPYNLLSYSEQLDNAYWSKYQATITANNTSAPNGSLTADKITQTGTGSATFYITSFPLSGGIVTLSCYYKKGTNNKSVLELNRTTQSFSAEFNLDTEVITATGNYVSTNMEDVGNGWFRCSVVSNQTAGTVDYFAFGNIGSNGTTLYAWGVQLNEGTIKDYQKTETRLNIPRLDYSNGTCPSILVEPQRTNLFLRSQEFENASWVKQNTILNANSIISPDGTQNAEKFIASNTSSLHAMFNLTATLSGLYTISIYAKKGEYDYIVLHEQFSGTFFGHFNLNTGVVMSGTGAKIESVGNGWYRCMVSFNALGVFNIPSFSPSNAFGDINYTGDGTSGIYIWGAQLEAGSYATSYIPTTSASVTRNADVISKTGIGSLIGQTEGTLFLDFYYNGLADNHMIINDSSFTSYIYFNSQNANQIWGQIQSVGIQFNTSATAGRYKCALAYKSGSSVMYVNGVQVGTSSTTFTLSGSISILDFTLSTPKNNINTSALWKTRLTNTQLAQLTTI